MFAQDHPSRSRPGRPAPESLGQLLLRKNLLTESELEWALEEQGRTGSRLGAIVVAAGLVRRIELYRALSEQFEAPFVDLTTARFDSELLAGHDPSILAREGWMPLRRLPDGRIEVATSEPPSESWAAQLQEKLGARCDLVLTTDWDILKALLRAFESSVADEATWGLWQRRPDQSARTVLNHSQKVVFSAVLVVLGVAMVLYPLEFAVTAVILSSLGFLVSVLFKTVICAVGARHERDEGITDAEVAAMHDDELPVYTVLVPVYREANVIGDLIENLQRLDYPKDKLEVFVLLEEDDHETIAAARMASPPENFVLVTIPDGHPKTKPKACNVGLYFSRGEYLVIYDAEDRPDPDQLKKSVLSFRRGGDRMICVQAALNYWNSADNLLTRMFTLEYSYWFDYMLPGLESLRLPIPLGGTSNHFRVPALRELGGWDPFNVTEDADLGIRASALGYTVGVVNSTTFEEANRATGNWIRQRSRWIKGYMQTFLVHLRDIPGLVHQTGFRQAAAFALLIGGTPVTFLTTLPLMALFAASLVAPQDLVSGFVPPVVLWIALFNLLVGNASMVYISMMGAFKRRRHRLVIFALLNPFYWLLHSVASYKALWQLIFKPHYWEKTLHGLSSAPGTAGSTVDRHVTAA